MIDLPAADIEVSRTALAPLRTSAKLQLNWRRKKTDARFSERTGATIPAARFGSCGWRPIIRPLAGSKKIARQPDHGEYGNSNCARRHEAARTSFQRPGPETFNLLLHPYP